MIPAKNRNSLRQNPSWLLLPLNCSGITYMPSSGTRAFEDFRPGVERKHNTHCTYDVCVVIFRCIGFSRQFPKQTKARWQRELRAKSSGVDPSEVKWSGQIDAIHRHVLQIASRDKAAVCMFCICIYTIRTTIFNNAKVRGQIIDKPAGRKSLSPHKGRTQKNVCTVHSVVAHSTWKGKYKHTTLW